MRTPQEAQRLGRYPAYPEYKDSGVEWLGEFPVHWEVKRLKHLATVDDEALPEDTDPEYEIVYVDIGGVDASAGIVAKDQYLFANSPSRARMRVRHGDVIVSTVRTYLRAIAPIVEPEPNLIVSTGFAVVRPRVLDYRFAAYALRAPYFVERVVAHSVGVSYPAINASEMVCFALAYPALDEQRAIAAFLDRETAKIDALVAKKQRLIELLQEKRTALISHAVTKGLDPNVPMKDSGVEWLGEIPAHWGVKRVKYVAPFSKERWREGMEEARYVGLEHIESGSGRLLAVPPDAPIEEDSEGSSSLFRPGDVLFGKLRPYLAKVVKPSFEGRCSTELLVLRSTGDLSPALLAYQLVSDGFIRWVDSMTYGTKMPRANPDQVLGCRIVLPPRNEQRLIVDSLDRETAKIDALATKVREGIERLKEYRTALISAAVTGKIDVREAIEPIPAGN